MSNVEIEKLGEKENNSSLFFKYIKENNTETFNIFQSIKLNLVNKIKESKLTDYEKFNLIESIGEINGIFVVCSDLEYYLMQNKGEKINNLAEFVTNFLALYYDFDEKQISKFNDALFNLKIKLINITREYLKNKI